MADPNLQSVLQRSILTALLQFVGLSVTFLQNKDTALTYAARHGHYYVVKTLLGGSAGVDIPTQVRIFARQHNSVNTFQNAAACRALAFLGGAADMLWWWGGSSTAALRSALRRLKVTRV